jgi:LacI family transcriptional regulator
MMLEVGVDGLIVTCSRLQEPSISKLIDQAFPIVLVSRRLQEGNSNFVVMDNHLGAYLATSHLIDCGCTSIAIISGPGNWSAGIERLEGYKRALLDKNLAIDAQLIKKGPFTKAFGHSAATKLLTLGRRPDAIFATNDDIALGVMSAAAELAIRIPEDLGLVGFDDTEISAHPNIALTTIRQKKYEMGELGMQLLKDLIERKNTHYTNQIVLEPELVVRTSCGSHLQKPPP